MGADSDLAVQPVGARRKVGIRVPRKTANGSVFSILAVLLRGGLISKDTKEALMAYTPNPLNTDDVKLPQELSPLTERLAEQIHDLWAKQRIKDGWQYGVHRDDSRKFHPCLVPYDQLSDEEKEYDRVTALGTLKTVIKLGYRVLPPETGDKP